MPLNDPHDTLSDLHLARLAARDERAFETLVRTHAPMVHRLAASLVGPGAADDIVQEVFIAAHRALKGSGARRA